MLKNEKGNNTMSIASEVFNAYGIPAELIPFGNGHINDTYVSGDYVIQRINTSVFKDPGKLMENIILVTSFLQKKLKSMGMDSERGTLNLLYTKDGKSYYTSSDGAAYRVCKLIKNTVSYDKITPELLEKAAYGFGFFQRLLADFDSSALHETIPDFHNTPKRYCALMEAADLDPLGRCSLIKEELDYISSAKDELSVVTDALANKALPWRVTHNDTKINNVLLDKDSGEFVAVIDLDTVMPGSLLYDYGDAVRSGANTAKEDEADLSLVGLDFENVRAFTKGFLTSIGNYITPKETELLPFSVRLLALELSIRFLTDYIMGDTYFKTSREGQNLDRARCQLRLAQVVQENMDELKEIVRACAKK